MLYLYTCALFLVKTLQFNRTWFLWVDKFLLRTVHIIESIIQSCVQYNVQCTVPWLDVVERLRKTILHLKEGSPDTSSRSPPVLSSAFSLEDEELISIFSSGSTVSLWVLIPLGELFPSLWWGSFFIFLRPFPLVGYLLYEFEKFHASKSYCRIVLGCCTPLANGDYVHTVASSDGRGFPPPVTACAAHITSASRFPAAFMVRNL